MIPLRIFLKGFLCYRDEQEVGLDGSSLWMLAGANGSGKSAVFDAVTYALFGYHRAGKQDAQGLINQGSDGLLVEFDFSLGKEQYRVKRTLRRTGKATQQVLLHQPGADGAPGHWQPVSETNLLRGFNTWVRDNIGLTYETFTASVLLMQGRAEKLLIAAPRERFEVLAGIVDLERYQRLHQRADNERRQLELQRDAHQLQLDNLPEVTEAQRAEAEAKLTAARTALEQARGQVDHLMGLSAHAKQWLGLREKQAQLDREWAQCEGLLAEADAIERGWQRLAELRGVLPHLQTVQTHRARLAQSVQASETCTAEQKVLTERLEHLNYALDQTRQKRATLQENIAHAVARERLVGGRLRELSGLLSRLNICEKQRRELARLEAALLELPARPDETLARAQEEVDRLGILRQALPLLRRFHEERTGLDQARRRCREAVEAGRAATERLQEATATAAALAEQGQRAAQAREQADTATVEARTRWDAAREQHEEFTHLEGAKLCRHCGQALSPAHFREELARRQTDEAQAEARYRQADEARQSAARQEKELLARRQEADRTQAQFTEQVREARRRHQQAAADAQRHGQACGQEAYLDLPLTFRSRISPQPPDDWAATTYPTPADLDEARRQAHGLDAAREGLQKAKEASDRWLRQRERVETLRESLVALEAELPGEVPALRREHAELEAEDTALREGLADQRERLSKAQADLEELEKEHTGVQKRWAAKERQLTEETVRREGYQEALLQARSSLPPAWQSAADSPSLAEDLRQGQNERDALEARGVERKAQEVQQARARLEPLRQRKTALQGELDAIPEEARCDPAEIQGQLTLARQTRGAREEEVRAAEKERDRLQGIQEQRRQLQQQFLEVDQRHNHSRLLAELLGRHRLQLHLVRQAERGIVDFANAALDRLSGGQLYLRLRGQEDGEGGAEQALQLEAYNRTAGQTPVNVSFLSGSQRFRVAVSLALGIGQYASRQHRPIESVIIDEGFGCLDRQGRQVMIQELQNLRGQLRCILLVSHQEEFAEAFGDGYHFELSDGTTKVKRFQR